MNTENIFDEKSLRVDIAKTWGEHGAHIDIYDRLLKQLSDLKEPVKQEGLLDLFIKEIKDEFHDENWEYLDFIKQRVLAKLPVSEVKEGEKEGSYLKSGFDCLKTQCPTCSGPAYTNGEQFHYIKTTAPIEKHVHSKDS